MNNTFVIVTWNNAGQITNLINSINRFEPESEIIIIDNNSQDQTVNLIKQAKQRNLELICLEDNLGFAKANNIAVKQVTTDYVTLINPDTIIESPLVDSLTKVMTSNVGIVGPKIINKDGSLQPSIFSFQHPLTILIEQFGLGRFLPEWLRRKVSPQNSKHDCQLVVDWLIGAFLFTKTEYYNEIGGSSEDYFLYSEDMDICYKYFQHHLQVLFEPTIQILHIGGSSEQQTTTSKSLKLLKSFCIFAKKYGFTSNISTLYYSYLLKYILFLPINKTRANRYKSNIKYLRGELK